METERELRHNHSFILRAFQRYGKNTESISIQKTILKDYAKSNSFGVIHVCAYALRHLLPQRDTHDCRRVRYDAKGQVLVNYMTHFSFCKSIFQSSCS